MTNLFKMKDDYYVNFDDITDNNLAIIKEFIYRPEMPIRKTNLPFIKVNQEDIDHFYFEYKNYDLFWDYFPVNNPNYSHVKIQQNFINMAVFIPSILYPNIDSNKLVKLFNSRNLENCYKKIMTLAGHNINNLVLVYTKRFYRPDKNGSLKFDQSKIKDNNGYYVIPQINIYINYHTLDGKYICELTGTLMS